MKCRFLVAALGGQEAPAEFLLFKDGWGELEDGIRYLIDQQAFQAIGEYVQRRGIDVVIDYEHQTLYGDKAPAAGWIKSLRYAEGEGIYAAVEWTAEAKAYICSGEYRYFSPVFMIRDPDLRVVALHSVALTNTPRTNNLQPILAKLGAEIFQEDTKMLKKLAAKLGLSDSASEEEVLQAVAKLAEKDGGSGALVAKDVLEALALDQTADLSTVVASINALKQAPKGMVSRAEFDALAAKLTDRDADDAVEEALKAGKITPDQRDWAVQYAKRDLKGFGEFVAKAPVVVPVDKPNIKTETAKTPLTDSTLLAVAKQLGVTPEDIKKFGGED